MLHVLIGWKYIMMVDEIAFIFSREKMIFISTCVENGVKYHLRLYLLLGIISLKLFPVTTT